MRRKTYPESARAAYAREMARHHQADLPLDELPSRAWEQTVKARAYVMLCNGSRTVAVYRIKPDTNLRRLRRWPKALELRL
jgi:hypothetical protein